MHLVKGEGPVEERLEVARVQRQRPVILLDRAPQVAPLAQRMAPGMVSVSRPGAHQAPMSTMNRYLLMYQQGWYHEVPRAVDLARRTATLYTHLLRLLVRDSGALGSLPLVLAWSCCWCRGESLLGCPSTKCDVAGATILSAVGARQPGPFTSSRLLLQCCSLDPCCTARPCPTVEVTTGKPAVLLACCCGAGPPSCCCFPCWSILWLAQGCTLALRSENAVRARRLSACSGGPLPAQLLLVAAALLASLSATVELPSNSLGAAALRSS